MISSRPYLIRALYEWIVDNEWVPHLLVDAQKKDVQVPEQFINQDGRIVLNISPEATRGLLIGNDRIIFTTRFSGVSYQVCVPPSAVKAIYAKENGEGMVFPDEEEWDEPTFDQPDLEMSENLLHFHPSFDKKKDTIEPQEPPPKPTKTPHRKPILKIVK